MMRVATAPPQGSSTGAISEGTLGFGFGTGCAGGFGATSPAAGSADSAEQPPRARYVTPAATAWVTEIAGKCGDELETDARLQDLVWQALHPPPAPARRPARCRLVSIEMVNTTTGEVTDVPFNS
eukprot:TRINITY_DN36977_c0_g1_i1.p4 TRINITY_DN36977_c0_g1~~TRINITY_DN36977_c0_g1_i1.p4  ORF type:complete len:125 (+),score=17.67 TRINITY_DN36977_c0_g1_i1:268-642(+)